MSCPEKKRIEERSTEPGPFSANSELGLGKVFGVQVLCDLGRLRCDLYPNAAWRGPTTTTEKSAGWVRIDLMQMSCSITPELIERLRTDLLHFCTNSRENGYYFATKMRTNASQRISRA